MSPYNFKGDLSSVSQRQLDFISEVLDKKGIKGQDALFEPVGKIGENYVANVKRITVDNNGTKLRMVAKFAPSDETMRGLIYTEDLFRNEHVVYTEILPKFKQLQLKAGISKGDMFRHPECYGSLSEAPHEVIVLEDLKESGFETLSRFKPLSTECVKITLKNLAIFHSLSYALKHSDLQSYNAFKSKLKDTITELWGQGEYFKMLFTGVEKMTLNSCLTEDKHKKAVKGALAGIVANAEKCMKADKDSKHSVIRQGDGWTNNIMFRMNNDIPEECTLIDYQLAYESSPVYDIMYMMFNSTDYEQRLKHYNEFIDYYHSELDKSLNNFGLKANYYYPREQLDADLKRFGKYAFGNAVMVSNFSLKKSEEAESAMKSMAEHEILVNGHSQALPSEMFELDPETFILYKKKVEGLIDSFLEFGLLSK